MRRCLIFMTARRWISSSDSMPLEKLTSLFQNNIYYTKWGSDPMWRPVRKDQALLPPPPPPPRCFYTTSLYILFYFR